MRAYPLQTIGIEAAKQLQFRFIDEITQVFDGREILSLGDLGVTTGINKPTYTQKVEQVLAHFFGVESAILVRGAGTGAIRWALASCFKSGEKILVHKAPIYPTTKVTVETMGLEVVKVDFHNLEDLEEVIKANSSIKGAIVQYTRQKLDDHYNYEEVIRTMKEAREDLKIITDDNYAAMKVEKIGCQYGADLSTFSTFKLLGPEGVGVVLGRKEWVDKIYHYNYSGGSQVQGHEAMSVLRGMVYAPVALAIQGEVNETLVERLNQGEVEKVKQAFIVNAQSKVVIVEFEENIARQVLEATSKLGAAAYPVGSESIYEFVPMIYRVSGTFRAQDPTLEERMIRINPMRSGADTIIRILQEAVQLVK